MLRGSSGERAGLTVTAYNKIPDILKPGSLSLWAVIAYDNNWHNLDECVSAVCNMQVQVCRNMCYVCTFVGLVAATSACVCVCGCALVGWMVLIISFEVVVILENSGTNYADCRECSYCYYEWCPSCPVSAAHLSLQLATITPKRENTFSYACLCAFFWVAGEKSLLVSQPWKINFPAEIMNVKPRAF